MKLIITFGFIVFDFITGIVGAFRKKEFTSSVMREGLYHKVGEISLIILAMLGDFAQRYLNIGEHLKEYIGIELTVPFATAVCIYIIMMEIGSIMENIGKINPALIPEKIKPFFHKLKEDDN